MTFDDLLKKADTEPNRVEEVDASVPSAELLDDLANRCGMPLTEFLSDPRRSNQRRTLRKGHVFGPPLPSESLDDWKLKWRNFPLPDDLQALLLRVNGIHLWADLDTGRSYQGLAPVEEWELARTKMWGQDADADMLGDEYLAISYHVDGADFVVLKVTTGEYFEMDACGADETCRIGGDVGALLDWIWDRRIP